MKAACVLVRARQPVDVPQDDVAVDLHSTGLGRCVFIFTELSAASEIWAAVLHVLDEKLVAFLAQHLANKHHHTVICFLGLHCDEIADLARRWPSRFIDITLAVGNVRKGRVAVT